MTGGAARRAVASVGAGFCGATLILPPMTRDERSPSLAQRARAASRRRSPPVACAGCCSSLTRLRTGLGGAEQTMRMRGLTMVLVLAAGLARASVVAAAD